MPRNNIPVLRIPLDIAWRSLERFSAMAHRASTEDNQRIPMTSILSVLHRVKVALDQPGADLVQDARIKQLLYGVFGLLGVAVVGVEGDALLLGEAWVLEVVLGEEVNGKHVNLNTH